ncbi:MAG TPA: ATP-dependent DNA helicase RecG, partial [Flavobacteriaceae bacterium]|nr:ATP-dependent DNA helicase RecG [Flavobacteriaceae bacterium]
MSSLLQTPIDYLKGVGTNRADLLRTELDIHTFQDLLNFFPFRYIDKTKYYKISELQRNSADVQVIGKITHIKTVEQKRGKRLVADFIDDTGKMELVWFRGHKWIKENLKLNTAYVIYGKVNHYNGTFSMPHPEMELYATHKEEVKIAMQPVYSSTEKLTNKGITQRFMGKMMQQVFIQTGATYEETLAAPLREELKLISKTQALRNIHFPKNSELLAKAQFRLKFEELFYIQLQMLSKNLQRKQRLK